MEQGAQSSELSEFVKIQLKSEVEDTENSVSQHEEDGLDCLPCQPKLEEVYLKEESDNSHSDKQEENNTFLHSRKDAKQQDISTITINLLSRRSSSDGSLPIQRKSRKLQTCPICEKKYSSQLCFEKHIKEHEESNEDSPKKSFRLKKKNTQNHTHRVYNKTNKEETCFFCQKKYTSKLCLEKHLKKHEENGEIDMKQVTNALRKYNKVKEKKKKNFDCDICHKHCRSNSDLKMHSMLHNGIMPFECDYCKFSFRTKCRLRDHIYTHMDERPYNCSICEVKRGFIKRSDFNKHMEKHATGQEIRAFTRSKFSHNLFVRRSKDDPELKELLINSYYKCEKCLKSYRNAGDLYRHIKTHGEKKYKCMHCGKSFHFRHVLEAHTQLHVNTKIYECSFCKAIFTTRGQMYRHRAKEHTTSVKCYKCLVCSRRFRFISTLTEHMMSHPEEQYIIPRDVKSEPKVVNNEEGSFDCDLCTRNYTDKEALRKHMYSHLDEKPFVCELCQKGFVAERNYLIHMQAHVDDGFAIYQCEICTKEYRNKKLLQQHMTTHGDKEFKCTFCPKAFHFKKGLNAHIQSHTHEKIYVCNDCGKYFYNPTTYYGHRKREHDPDGKNHKCSYCEKSYINVSSLNEHIVCHTKEKPYMCSYCGKLFSYRSDFRRHVIKHHEPDSSTTSKIFQCEICSRTYTTRNILTRHLKEHNSDRKFACTICSKAFHYKTTLKKHMETHDPDRYKRPYYEPTIQMNY